MNIKNGFTQIDTCWIDDINLSDSAFRTLVVLKAYQFGSNKIFPSIETLAKRRGKSKTTIINHHNELKEKGYISTKRRGYSMSNEYSLISQKNCTNEVGSYQKYDTSIDQESFHQRSNNFKPNNITNNINLSNFKNSLKGKEYEKAKEKLFLKNPWLNKKNN